MEGGRGQDDSEFSLNHQVDGDVISAGRRGSRIMHSISGILGRGGYEASSEWRW